MKYIYRIEIYTWLTLSEQKIDVYYEFNRKYINIIYINNIYVKES